MKVRDSPEARSTRQVRNSRAQNHCFVSAMRAEERTDMVSSDPETIKPPNPGVPCDLNPNETLLCRTRFHWIILSWPVVFAILFSLPGVAALIAVPAPGGSTGGTLLLAAAGLFFLAVAAAIGFIAYLRWESREAILTNSRLIFISGIIRTEMTSIALGSVESAKLRQSLLGKALGYGTVVVYQVGAPVRSIRKIPHPENPYQSLQAQLKLNRKQ
jgi:hypothetical protein